VKMTPTWGCDDSSGKAAEHLGRETLGAKAPGRSRAASAAAWSWTAAYKSAKILSYSACEPGFDFNSS